MVYEHLGGKLSEDSSLFANLFIATDSINEASGQLSTFILMYLYVDDVMWNS